jgi:hypothetical protein
MWEVSGFPEDSARVFDLMNEANHKRAEILDRAIETLAAAPPAAGLTREEILELLRPDLLAADKHQHGWACKVCLTKVADALLARLGADARRLTTDEPAKFSS